MDIKNSVAFISGGASGMGLATATLLAEMGATVVIFDLNLKSAEKAASHLKAHAFFCDVTKSESVVEATEKAIHLVGPPRIAVNCAGIVSANRMVGKEGPLPLDNFANVIAVNLTGTFNVMRMAAHAMIPLPPLGDSHERGIIINTASIAAFEGQIGQVAYSASKGGIVSMTLPAARELAQFGIRVMTIAPGLVDTPMFEKIPEDARNKLADSVPFPKRLAKPEEYAKLAVQIIENPMLNGSVIRLDGALRMQAK